MDDLTLVSLSEAAGWFPRRDGRKLSLKAIRRRIHKGVSGVRLKAQRDGGEWFTCREWVTDFLETVTDARLAPPQLQTCGAGVTPERVKRRLARRYGIHAAK